MSEIPVLDVAELDDKDEQTRARVNDTLRTALGRYGVLHLSGHGLAASTLDQLYEAFWTFTQKPEEEKRAYCRADLWYQRGWTPPNTEHAVVAGGQPDFKECYFVSCTGIDARAAEFYPELFAQNIWPDDIVGFQRTYEEVATKVHTIGERVLRACERALELPTLSLVDVTRGGAHVTRLLHYLPVDQAAIDAGVLWGENHTDFNTLTLLPGGRFLDADGERAPRPYDGSGLHLTTRGDDAHPEGEKVSGTPPDGCMVVQVGQQLEILTGGALLATPHEIRAPKQSGLARMACAHFIHMHPEQKLFPLQAFQTPEARAQYRPPMLAGTYALKTLVDIGLAPPEALERFGYRNYDRIKSQSEFPPERG